MASKQKSKGLMEILAEYQREQGYGPKKKEDLKVGTKEPAKPMVGMGPYKDGSVYASALAKAKAKLATSGNKLKPQTNPVTKDELKTPETQNQDTPPPTETRKETGEQTTRQFADLRGGGSTEDKSYRSPGAGTQPKVTPASSNESKSDTINTEATVGIKKELKKFLSSVQKQLAKAPASSQGIRIGTKNKAGKFWAGSKYGFQSEASYKKLKAAGKI